MVAPAVFSHLAAVRQLLLARPALSCIEQRPTALPQGCCVAGIRAPGRGSEAADGALQAARARSPQPEGAQRVRVDQDALARRISAMLKGVIAVWQDESAAGRAPLPVVCAETQLPLFILVHDQ